MSHSDLRGNERSHYLLAGVLLGLLVIFLFLLAVTPSLAGCGSRWWKAVREHPEPLQEWLLQGAQSVLELRDFDGDGKKDVWALRNESPVAACRLAPLACSPEFRVVSITVTEVDTGLVLLHREWCGGVFYRVGWGEAKESPCVLIIIEQLYTGQRVIRTVARGKEWEDPRLPQPKSKDKIPTANAACAGASSPIPTTSGSGGTARC